ncbi:glucosamine inositolphosphorylceramide transferase family protein [Stappia sp. ICDLI1TA098]
MTSTGRTGAGTNCTIATGSDARFARTLFQLLANLKRYRVCESARVLVYDLGLSNEDRALIAARFPFAEVIRFPFADHPPHVAVAAGTYAWKPLAIADAAERFGGHLFWFDSATLLRADLSEPLSVLAQNGSYTLKGQANLSERCLPEVLTYLRVEPEFFDRQIRIGGLLGFDLERAAVRRLVEDWARLAGDPLAFRPATPRHNADQTVLTILLLRAEAAGDLVLNGDDVDISSPQPIRWASTRNKITPDRPSWTDPLQRLWHRLYKAGDRANLRWQDFYRRRLLGLHRLPKEHFQVFVMRSGNIRPTAVSAPAFSYYADPFLRRIDGRLWLFVEEFEYLEQRGRLVAMELDEALKPGPPVPVLPIREHASYPFLFEVGGVLHMLPETCAMGALDLYRCERFPDRWRRVRRMKGSTNAVDAVIFEEGGGWRLVLCERPEGADGARTLAVYHMDDPVTGGLVADPVNAKGIFADGSHGLGRGAGDVFADAEGPMRVMQNNRSYYGQAVEVRRIGLDADGAYLETPVGDEHPLAEFARLTSPHHVSMAGDCVAFDLRTRLGFVSGIPWLGRKLSGLDPAAKRFLSGERAITDALARLLPELVAQVRPLDGKPQHDLRLSSGLRDGG